MTTPIESFVDRHFGMRTRLAAHRAAKTFAEVYVAGIVTAWQYRNGGMSISALVDTVTCSSDAVAGTALAAAFLALGANFVRPSGGDRAAVVTPAKPN